MHLLHLEDSPNDSELTQALVRSHWPECSISSVNSKATFQAAVERGSYDVILSDYTMPGYDGLSALDYAQSVCPHTPFIYLSGTIGEERAIEALKRGATDYVIKDRPARLISAIESALTQVEQEHARERAEQKVREQASLLDKAHEAICVVDLNRRITYWNARAELVYGWPAKVALGSDLRELLYPTDTAPFDEAFATALADGEWRGELRPQPWQREALIVESFWSIVADESGQAQSVFIIDADITEKKRLEAQLMQTQRLETIGLLAGGIAHDMNNVLAPILTSVDLLGHLATHPNDRELLDTLETSVQHGVELVRQLLSFARGEGEQRRELAIDAMIGSVRRLMHNALRSNIDLRVALPDNLAMINADPTQLRQALLNLCINARDAMPDGGSLEISAENIDVTSGTPALLGEVQRGPHVCIRVTDTGTGIPPQVISKLFEPFFTTKKPGKGTGLGLANVAGVMKSHSGFIQVESTLGVGTSFRLYFPAIPQSADRATSPSVASVPVQGHGENILVIEDDDAVRTVLEIILSTRDYRVFAAKDGEEGLAELRQNPGRYALVTTDLQMPGMNGTDVVQELRALPNPPKIIVLSGLPRSLQDTPAELDDVEYLCKPITVDGLLGTVRRVLDGVPPAQEDHSHDSAASHDHSPEMAALRAG